MGARLGGRPLCAGSGVMCRVKRGTLRSGGTKKKTTANLYKGRRFLFNGRFEIMIQRYKKSINYQVFEKIMSSF